MTRDEYKSVLQSKGFVFVESQEAWSQHRGEEDKYTHPSYGNYFYVKRISDDDNSPYGFNAQVYNGKVFDNISSHNVIDTFRNKQLLMWTDNAFLELMNKLSTNSWVVTSNPTTYSVEGAFSENEDIDWATKNKFAIGDIVYIYEVIPPKGRGGIVYKTRVTQTNVSLAEKIDDRKYWLDEIYPKTITEQTKFSRLKRIGIPDNSIIRFDALKEYGFVAPQSLAHRVTDPLSSFIESFFQNANSAEDETLADTISLYENFTDVTEAVSGLSNQLPPERVIRIVQKIVRNPKISQDVKIAKDFICEVCGLKPFIQKNGLPYAEADHIQPLGGDYRGIDSPENMRCLCAQCHAIITHGSDEIIKKLLSTTKWRS